MNGESQKILSGNFEAWCYQTLAGINYDPQRPGFKHIILRPRPVGDLKWVRAAHRSMYGEIKSAWKTDGEKLRWDVTVPPNTTATAYVPTSGAAAAIPRQKSGMKLLRRDVGALVYELLPGSYSFESVLDRSQEVKF